MKPSFPLSIFNFQFFAFVKKEFFHIWRDKRTMFILLGMPVVQIVIFGFALTNEVKNANIAILDNSKDAATVSLTTQLDASRYFALERNIVTSKQIEEEFRRGKIKLAIVFPQAFWRRSAAFQQSTGADNR